MYPSFDLFGEKIYFYPLIMGMIWALSYQLSKELIKKNEIEIKYFNVYFISTFLISWLGAKTIFLLTLEEEVTSTLISSPDFWFGGGLVFYGGAIFGILYTIIYASIFTHKLSQFTFLIPILTLGHSLGRIGCLLAGCCYGKACDLPWAIHLHGEFRHPVQIYESLCLFLLSIYLFKRYLSKKSVILQYVFAYSIIRFILEFFRGDKIRGTYFYDISTSQIISLFLISISVFLILGSKAKK